METREEKAAQLFHQNEPLRGLLLDGIGSAAVDSLAEEACQIEIDILKEPILVAGLQCKSQAVDEAKVEDGLSRARSYRVFVQ